MSLVVYLVGLAVIAAVAVAIAAPLLWPHAAAPSAPPGDPERYRLEKEKELAYAAIKEADFDLQNVNTGALIECCAGPRRGVPPRPDRAYRGQMIRSAAKDGERPSLLSTLGDSEQLTSYIKVGDWNQIHLIVRERTMIYSINGHLMSVFIDDHPTMFVDHGFLALQLEGRGDVAVYFRNLWLKNLPQAQR